jgi:phage anti-repressor protein
MILTDAVECEEKGGQVRKMRIECEEKEDMIRDC